MHLSNFPTIEELMTGVESELHDVLDSRDMDLYRMMSYHLGWEDDRGQPQSSLVKPRSHGVACLTACYAAGGDLKKALPAAAAVEMVSNFCQIHDDVQGGHPKRHGRDAVWWVWGPAQAIDAGDGCMPWPASRSSDCRNVESRPKRPSVRFSYWIRLALRCVRDAFKIWRLKSGLISV